MITQMRVLLAQALQSFPVLLAVDLTTRIAFRENVPCPLDAGSLVVPPPAATKEPEGEDDQAEPE
jgi:hypothetical protein